MTRDEALGVLGLEAGATPAEIAAAHRELAQMLHPDKFGDNKRLRERAEQQMRTINEARDVLMKGSRASSGPARPGSGLMEDGRFETIFSLLKEVMMQNSGTEDRKFCFIFSGSKVNAMKYIFEDYKYFYRTVEHVPITPVDGRDIVEHVMRGFQNSGKVIEQDMIRASCELFRGNLWYINHYMAICDSMTKGYINDGILMEALRMMLSLHEPRFMRMMYSLTVYQINMLKAILDGVVKFSSTEVIEKYGFNSSANVRRVKDALCKKEIVTFNERDEALVLDPLFEHWLRKYYFEIPELQQ